MKKAQSNQALRLLVVVGLVFEQGLGGDREQVFGGDTVLDADGEDGLKHLVTGQGLQFSQPFVFPH